jgi:hypothetical protein
MTMRPHLATFLLTIIATAAVLACTASAAPDPAAPDPAAPDPAPTNHPAPKSAPMHSGFTRAQASFRTHAARALKLAPERLVISPVEEDPSVQLDQRVGAAWAFVGAAKDHPATNVRGWATADGTVVTPSDNLGVLFVEAGVWTAKPALDANALAERLVWAMGMNHRVVGARSLQVDAQGNGSLKFQVAYRPPGPGGAGGGPERISQCTVTLTAQHRALLVAVDAPPAPAKSGLE